MSLKSATEKLKRNLRASRKAILGRGGEISATAGLKDLPEAIFNIPVDTSLAFYEDSEVAYRKTVPDKVEEFAMLKKLGGMTYKCKNLFKASEDKNGTLGNLSYSYEKDKSEIVFNGIGGNGVALGVMLKAGTYTISVYGDLVYNSLQSSKGGYVKGERGNVTSGISTVFTLVSVGNPKTFTLTEDTILSVGVVTTKDYTYNNTAIKIQIEEGSTATEYEPYFEGLRDTKPTELVSEGVNLAHFRGWSANTTSFNTTNNQGTTISTTEAVNSISVTQTKTGNTEDPLHYDNGYILYMLTKDLTIGKKYNVSFDIAIKSNPLNVNAIKVKANGHIFSSEGVFDGSSTEKQRVNVTLVYQLNPNNTELMQIEFRNCGMSLDISNVMITEEAVTDITYKPLWTASKPIPEAVQALDGYGKGVSAEYNNHIEWRDGRAYFVKKVERIVLDGSEKWSDYGSTDTVAQYWTNATDNLFSSNSFAISNKFEYSKSKIANTFQIASGAFQACVKLDKASFPTVDDWKAQLKTWSDNGEPFEIIGQLAEPIETDITDLFTEDNFIKVEGGGTITMANEHEYAVPTTIKYTRKVES